MKQYKDLLTLVLEKGTFKADRTGTGTYSIFGHQMRFDLNEGFPLVTCKYTAFKTLAKELVWFINGDTNIKWLVDNNCHIWDEWADDKGNLGPVYGAMWRSWPTYEVVSAVEYKNVDVTRPGDARYEGATVDYKEIDQLKECINQIKNNPDSRRIIVTAWNPQYLPTEKVPKDNPAKGKQALPPCHAFFQFYVADGKLSCQLYQRSCDLFLGVPFNIASYALLVHIMAHHCGLKVGEFIWTGGDVHLYANHIEQAKRALNNQTFDLPTLKIVDRNQKTIEDYRVDDFVLENYRYADKIVAKVSV